MRLARRPARLPSRRPQRRDFAVGVSTPGAVTFPTTDLACEVYAAMGADLTLPPSSWVWYRITPYVRFAPGITTTQGRQDWTSTVRTSAGQMVLDNRDGRFSRRNPNSPYFGLLTYNTPIWCTIDAGSGPVTRMQMFVNEWPTRWDRSGKDSTVPIQCAGIMRRLQQGAVLSAPLRRAILTAVLIAPVAYWPLEGGLASGLPTGNAMTVAGTVSNSATVFPAGSTGAFDFTGGGTATGVTGQAGAAATSVDVEFNVGFASLPSIGAVMPIVTTFLSPGTNLTSYGLTLGDTGDGNFHLGFWYRDGTGLHTAFDSSSASAIAVDQTYHVQFNLVQSGANVVVTMTQDGGGSVALVNTIIVSSATLAAPTTVTVSGAMSPAPSSVSHVAVWVPARSPATSNAAAAVAYIGELATTRIRRLAAEEGVPMVCTSGVSGAMGAQATDTFLNLLRDCEAVDGGVLYEVNWGLGFQALNDRINQSASLALDFDQFHIAVEPQPADDDQRLRNRWTVNRTGGGEAIKERTSGPLGTQPGGPGVYDDSAVVDVYTDDQLGSQAGWRLHLGTVDEDRWPSIAIRLHGTPGLIPSWVAMPFGARTTISNPPDQVAPDLIDAVVEGWSERWDHKTWVATLNTSPYSPYLVGTLAADTGDTSSTLLILTPTSLALAVDVNTTDTSWSVTSSPLWTTNSEMFPRRIMWEGEEVRLTNCSGASAPQTWTVVRSINGVVKSHTANSTLQAYRGILHPGVLALA